MDIIKATSQQRDEIIDLLQKENLPAEDLPLDLSNFFTAIEENTIIGLIGLEPYGENGLLRSMVVSPNYRNQQIAERLVKMLEEQAIISGINTIYLLTETADKYFSRKGYKTIAREEVPTELKASSEFSHVCPVSAIVMKKELAEQAVTIDL
ncbi:MAG: arsenic resistance N-acetyltransferase ArsN2 [Candidatus Dadabacteria bacterium]